MDDNNNPAVDPNMTPVEPAPEVPAADPMTPAPEAPAEGETPAAV